MQWLNVCHFDNRCWLMIWNSLSPSELWGCNELSVTVYIRTVRVTVTFLALYHLFCGSIKWCLFVSVLSPS